MNRFNRSAFVLTVCASLLFSAAGFAAQTGLESKRYDFGLAGGMWLSGGDVSMDSDPVYIDATKESCFLMRGFIDMYVAPLFATGIYANFAPSISYEDTDVTQTMYEFGFSFKPRILFSPTVALKPGLNIGYRKYTSSDDMGDDMNALGTNLSLEFQILTDAGFILSIEPGFLAQPVGGNADWAMSYPPIMYLLVGLTF